MTRVLFVGVHAAAAAALVPAAAYDGPSPPVAVREALEEAGVDPAPARPWDWAEVVVDTDAWQLPEPVGLCLEEARELLAAIAERAR
jgi:8-oxo-dGTP pyrophosphatase MutT (NUDIX family)